MEQIFKVTLPQKLTVQSKDKEEMKGYCFGCVRACRASCGKYVDVLWSEQDSHSNNLYV